MKPLTTDEIIEEIHAVRREHAAKFDYDVSRIIADLKKSERAEFYILRPCNLAF